MTPRWPGDWPTRPADAPAPDPAVAPDRELVGATPEPVRLTGASARVSVPIDQRAVGSLRRSLRAPQQRAYLDVEDIDAARSPGTVYGVYVNLPADPTDEDLALHHVGNLSLFGIERARNPRGDGHGHGLRISMEITPVLDRLAAGGTWQDGRRIDVTFRPLTLEAPEDEEGDEDESAPEEAVPAVTLGRVSVHYA